MSVDVAGDGLQIASTAHVVVVTPGHRAGVSDVGCVRCELIADSTIPQAECFFAGFTWVKYAVSISRHIIVTPVVEPVMIRKKMQAMREVSRQSKLRSSIENENRNELKCYVQRPTMKYVWESSVGSQ